VSTCGADNSWVAVLDAGRTGRLSRPDQAPAIARLGRFSAQLPRVPAVPTSGAIAANGRFAATTHPSRPRSQHRHGPGEPPSTRVCCHRPPGGAVATAASLPHPPPNRGELAAATAATAAFLHHSDLGPTIRASTARPWPRAGRCARPMPIDRRAPGGLIPGPLRRCSAKTGRTYQPHLMHNPHLTHEPASSHGLGCSASVWGSSSGPGAEAPRQGGDHHCRSDEV
jgi:hypothetical protein